jgi:electron transfer flavoprotein alpha subunit
MRILVFLEEHAGSIRPDGLGLVTKAKRLGAVVDVLICGSGGAALDMESIGRCGADRVFVADDPRLGSPLPQPRVDVIAGLHAECEFDAILFATSVLAADVAGGVAARLETGINWDLVDLTLRDEELIGTRLALRDQKQLEVSWTTAPAIALFRSGACESAPIQDGSPVLTEITASIQDWSLATTHLESISRDHNTAELASAEVIVAGGRGLGDPSAIGLVEQLADALGGAVGVTMPLVEMGWAAYARQVGQTGTVVKPRLYVACGISGMVQHKVGMERSATIVAINTDGEAPIMRFSDLAVVADLHRVIPELIGIVRTRQRASS